jgi:plastocyanin
MSRLRTLLLVVVVALAVGACGSNDNKDDGSASNTTEATSGAAPAATITIKDLKFNPDTVTVKKGDAVEWQWDESVLHNVTGDGFKSDNQSDGTFDHTFTKSGSYAYQCTLHAGMKGTVEVQ